MRRPTTVPPTTHQTEADISLADTNLSLAGVDRLVAAVDRAERDALDDHRAGRCSESEWSCSHCDGVNLSHPTSDGVRQTYPLAEGVSPTRPLAVAELLAETDQALTGVARLEARIAEVWDTHDATPGGAEREAVAELAWRLEDLADNPHLRRLLDAAEAVSQ